MTLDFSKTKNQDLKNAQFADGTHEVKIQVIVGTEPGDESKFDGSRIDTASPDNVTLNLFDYWVEAETAHDHPEDQRRPQHETTFRTCGIPGCTGDVKKVTSNYYIDSNYYNKGINGGHALVFSPAGNLTGGWNFDTGNPQGDSFKEFDGGPYRGLVKNTLGKDGYPVLNIPQEKIDAAEAFSGQIRPGDESLAYLFSDNDAPGKKAYSDVKGLFKIDSENGNYIYNSVENFASFDKENNRFNVYNFASVSGGDTQNGQFFPFNTASQVFKTNENGTPVLTENGMLTPKEEVDSGLSAFINHYFGLTMDVKFQQPQNGQISNAADPKDMVFEFSGDDDVWIFIDGVLAADLGGVHSAVKVTINFATGDIKIDRADRFDKEEHDDPSREETTIKKRFKLAGVDTSIGFEGETFAGNTTHELKMFYMERGNFASNLELSFNLLEPRNHNMVKVDQHGKELGGVSFELYNANDDFTPQGSPIATLTTDNNGYVDFLKPDGKIIEFVKNQKYVLREIKTKDGFITTGDIHLTFDETAQTLMVENMWETGAVSGFEAQITQAGDLKYATGEIANGAGKKGLILAVPLYNKTNKGAEATEGWQPLYGSITEGFQILDVTESNAEGYRRAALTATLEQLKNPENERWHLEYDELSMRYEGVLRDLPGVANRYVFMDKENGDMLTSYYLLLPDDGLFDNCHSADEKYMKLLEQINATGVEGLVDKYQDNMRLLNISDFSRLFHTRLYIPNKVRELRIHKQDEENNPLAGAEFTLYSDKECKKPVAMGVTDENGMLSFSAQNSGNNAVNGGELSSKVNFPLMRTEAGSIRVDRSYWLKETNPPEGYILNRTVSEVRITHDSIYVNAGTADNGVSVRKGIGHLLQTMTRYVASDELNVTLRDILATKGAYGYQTDGENLPDFTKWDTETDEQPLKLHYGLEGSALLDYGLHDTDRKPYFETDIGWMGLGIKQNFEAHSNGNDQWSNAGGKKEDIRNENISALFTGTTTVIITDEKKPPEIELTVKKTVTTANEGQSPEDRDFNFTAKITKDGNAIGAIKGTKTVNGEEQAVTLSPNNDGVYTFTLKHNESLVLKELPKGVAYEVTETEANQNNYTTSVTASPADTVTGIDNTAGRVTDTYADENAVLQFTNAKKPGADFTFTKVDAKDKIELDGAEFSLYELVCTNTEHGEGYHDSQLVDTDNPGGCWLHIKTVSSNPDVTFTELYTDKEYRLVETKAPDGYTLPSGQWKLVVNLENGKPVVTPTGVGEHQPPAFEKGEQGALLLPNMQPMDIPGFGGTGTLMFALGGVLLIGGGIALLILFL